jgi:hypothetical protein
MKIIKIHLCKIKTLKNNKKNIEKKFNKNINNKFKAILL